MSQIIVNGLLIGGIYALVAVGLSMNFGVMRIINFAHGDFLMLGMYASWLLFPLLGFNSIPYFLIPPVGIIMFLVGVLIFKLSISKVVGTNANNSIILTMGLSLFLQNAVQIAFSADFLSIGVDRDFQLANFKVGNLYISKPRAIAFGIAIILVAIIFWFLKYTDTGRAMRATSENATVAQTLGINTKRVYTISFGIGVVLAGIAGLLLTPIYYVFPKVGSLFTTMAMSAMVLGGLGSIIGALVGGLIIGLIEASVGTLFSLDLALIVNSAVLILLLFIKPTGLFGGGIRKA